MLLLPDGNVLTVSVATPCDRVAVPNVFELEPFVFKNVTVSVGVPIVADTTLAVRTTGVPSATDPFAEVDSCTVVPACVTVSVPFTNVTL